MKYLCLLLITNYLIISCLGENESQNNVGSTNSLESVDPIKSFLEQNLSEGAVTTDTLEKNAYSPFKYFNSGYIMQSGRKHALYVEQKDTLCTLHLYEQLLNEFHLVDSIENVPFNGASFNLELLDFNFDGVKDIFLQNTASNGYVMRRGSLIEYLQNERKLLLHDEIGDLANFRLDQNKKQVIAESPDHCGNPEYFHPAEVRLEWQNGKLIEVSRNLKCN